MRVRVPTRNLVRWLGSDGSVRSRRIVSLAVAIAVNVLFIGLYVWSRGGAATVVRVEVVGNHYEAFVDGNLVAEALIPGRNQGGIGIALPSTYPLSSLPQPRGVDSVRVTDVITGDVLLEDTFDGPLSPVWETGVDGWTAEDGILSNSTTEPLTTGPLPWSDYVLEVKFRNVTDAKVHVRMEDLSNTVSLDVFRFDHNFGGPAFIHMEDGTAARYEGLGPMSSLDKSETLKSMVAMLLRPYPILVLMLGGVTLLACLYWLASPLLSRVRFPRGLQAAGNRVLKSSDAIAIGLTAGAVALLWYLLYVVGDAMPHVVDSVSYIFQAKMFASFQLTADAPPAPENFTFFRNFLLEKDGRWFTHYPFGHPLLLAIGQFFGAIWLVPPILGAASVAFIYWIGKRVYGASVGLMAATLLLFSPFFLMTASNFMSHNTAAFSILACLFFLTLPTKRRLPAMLFAGVFLGLLFNMRPLVALAFMPPLICLLGYEFVRAGSERGRLFREDLAFATGGLLLLGAWFLYNQATTGDFMTTAYELQGTFTSDNVGFGGTHSVSSGLQNEQEQLALFVLVANGWPAAIGLILAAVPFLLGSRHRWDYFLAASLVFLVAAPILYSRSSIMHGPRFWYEATPFLMLLTARGAHYLRDAGSQAGDWLAQRFLKRRSVSTVAITSVAFFSLVTGLIAFSAYGWLFEQREAWSGLAFVPHNASQLDGFNAMDRRLVDSAEELDLENALVFLPECVARTPGLGTIVVRYCYASVFWTNSPNLDGDVVWAVRTFSESDRIVLEHFRGRELYLAAASSAVIRPISEEELLSGLGQ